MMQIANHEMHAFKDTVQPENSGKDKFENCQSPSKILTVLWERKTAIHKQNRALGVKFLQMLAYLLRIPT